MSETGVIIDDYLVLTAGHVVKHLRDYRLENSILVNPDGEEPLFVIQGKIPIDVPLEQALLSLTDTNRI